MTQIKFTKNELREQQYKLNQLTKYLPTLQLKKAMLQMEINQANLEIEHLSLIYEKEVEIVEEFEILLSADDLQDLLVAVAVQEVKKGNENIAGVEFPTFEEVVFGRDDYPLFSTPLWWDDAIETLRSMLVAGEKVKVVKEKKEALAKELREVSIRVNLFEKILIPRHEANIKKIKVFLGDQQLAAVAQAKAAKRKILEKRA